MLVLTTMFINVSNNLPKTSYMKMVDVWLLFNLMYPFIVVLMHTYMDSLRNDEEKDEVASQINSIQTYFIIFLFQDESVKAASNKHVQHELKKKKSGKLLFWRRMTLVHTPVFGLLFMVVYWVSGLRHAGII